MHDFQDNFIKKINNFAKKNNYPIEAVNWRVAAGPTAQYVFWLRIVLLIGIFIVLFAGLIVVTNTLVINVLDRTIIFEDKKFFFKRVDVTHLSFE